MLKLFKDMSNKEQDIIVNNRVMSYYEETGSNCDPYELETDIFISLLESTELFY